MAVARLLHLDGMRSEQRLSGNRWCLAPLDQTCPASTTSRAPKVNQTWETPRRLECGQERERMEEQVWNHVNLAAHQMRVDVVKEGVEVGE